jgi:phosphatidylserine/phosphatidylglycerophosphate/cardiolipin synthase-like enzyme
MKRILRLFQRQQTDDTSATTAPNQTAAAVSAQGWWAAGDAPSHTGCHVTPLVDGREAMHAMCIAFLRAEKFILLAGWDMQANLQMVRGEDARAGTDGSPEQQRLIEQLRAVGLNDEAIALWTAGTLRVTDVLGFAARRGVRVGVLLWDAFHLGSHLTNDPEQERKELTRVGVDCLLDDSSRHITHITQALHQKCAVVDGRIGFLGGVDLTAQYTGDYDRWDTHQHPARSPDRLGDWSAPAHPWHDVHTMIEGPAVIDVQRNITQRWMEVASRHHLPDWPGQLATDAPAPIADGVTVQVTRTIPPNTYTFAPDGIATIRDMYVRAISQARSFIYFENQYLWPEVYLGLDSLRWGERSPEAMEVLEAMGAALDRGVALTFVLPDHPNCGRRFTDGGIAWLRERSPRAAAQHQLAVFTLGADERDGSGRVNYRPVYVHAKVAIIDDTWWTAGSANLNSRGLQSDAEINIAVLDTTTARELRVRLWTEHLQPLPEVRVLLEDPRAGLAALTKSAETNLERVRRGEPLNGHVLPYAAADDAQRLNLSISPELGWLDNLEGGAGPLPAHYAHRYL